MTLPPATPGAAAARPGLAPEPALLEVRGLTKTFPGARALDGVDFTLRHGEIHALLGENGAGKSTLIKTVTGYLRRTAGTVRLEGAEIAPRNTGDAQALGLASVYQEVNLLPNLSVADNLFLGRQPTRLGMLRRREMNARARTLLREFGLSIDPARLLGDFSVAVQQMVAIARAVDLSAKLLILDEPTASLDAAEVALLFDTMRRLKARGIGIVFVTHFLDQVYAVSDRITVLRNGRLVGSWDTAALPRLKLVSAMLGHDLDEAVHARKPAAEAALVTGLPAIRFERFGKQRYVQPFDLAIRAGEAVGVAGLLGSGRTETTKLVFGAERADSGQAYIDDKPVALGSVRDAIGHGFGYVPEERKTEGIVGELSVRENIALALQARRGWMRPLSRRRQLALAEEYIRLLDIRPPDPERPVQLLSGGNQQKVVLARWLAMKPRLLILDEPTRGIDVGAHAEIVALIRRLCAEGMAMLVVSSELEEIVTYADRVVVLRDRAHIGTLEGEAVTVSQIVQTIAGGTAPSSTEVPA